MCPIKSEVLVSQGYPGVLGTHLKRYSDPAVQLSPYEQFALDTAALGRNLFITGIPGAGKSPLLHHIATLLEASGKSVVLTGGAMHSAAYIRGIQLTTFLGLKHFNAASRKEQVEGVLERHIRLMSAKFFNALPTIMDVDVLVIDDIDEVPIVVLEALDSVSRRLRHRESELFGGLQIVSAGNFFSMKVTPDLGHSGFTFQHPFWETVFPPPQQVALLPDDSDRYRNIVTRAYFGLLKYEDVAELEQGSELSDIFPQAKFLDDMRSARYLFPRFPKYRCTVDMHKRFTQLRSTDFGWLLGDSIYAANRAFAYGLPSKLSLEIGETVQFQFGTVDESIRVGELGIVEELANHYVRIRFPFLNDRVDTIPEMRIRTSHIRYPDINMDLTVFPFLSRNSVGSVTLGYMRSATRYVDFDPRLIASINGLGKTLSRLHKPKLVPGSLREYLKRDRCVHEATKTYFEQLFQLSHPDWQRWCKNCKRIFPTVEFPPHWKECVRQTRWCTECDASIPASHWESHAERHTVVLCFDCGKNLQWREWENHRKVCPGMLKEISPDNPFIPADVRALALSLGHDRKELHDNPTIKTGDLKRMAKG